MLQSFTPEVVEKLKTYVYRLIDPRNGETFYIGKGKGNRVFAHIRAEIDSDYLVTADGCAVVQCRRRSQQPCRLKFHGANSKDSPNMRRKRDTPNDTLACASCLYEPGEGVLAVLPSLTRRVLDSPNRPKIKRLAVSRHHHPLQRGMFRLV